MVLAPTPPGHTGRNEYITLEGSCTKLRSEDVADPPLRRPVALYPSPAWLRRLVMH